MISTAISRSQAGRWLAFAVMLTGGLLPSVDFFIINVSLPSIHASLGADPAELQLVVCGQAAGYTVFLITVGRLGDCMPPPSSCTNWIHLDGSAKRP